MTKTNNITTIGVLVSLSIIFGYIEHLFPSPISAVPGIKIGLANVVIVLAMYLYNNKTALTINICRIILSSILFGNLSIFIYSLFGGLISFLVMVIAKKTNVFGLLGVSVLGGVSHNIGQIIIAILVINNVKLLYYLPLLVISGIISGGINALIVFTIRKSIT